MNTINDNCPVRDFYDEQVIFITGGTGSLGKLLVEKLLRLCESVKRIYVLVREKKGLTVEDRLEKFFDSPCFDRLKRSPTLDFRSKLCFVAGDCKSLGLGLSEPDRTKLSQEVTLVIYAAASVKFDQSLRAAVYNNVRGVQEAIALAKEMGHLRGFVYVSTAYSNCIYPQINERFYKPPVEAEDLLKILEIFSEDGTLDAMTPSSLLLAAAVRSRVENDRLLGQYPNTYVFSKAIAEDLLRRESKNLPVVIIRPALIFSTKEEPMPGWVDNFHGPLGITAGCYLGVIRCVKIKISNRAELVPGDYVANLVLAAAWKLNVERCKGNTSPRVYNFAGSNKNRTNWATLDARMSQYANEVPTNKMIWYNTYTLTESNFWYTVDIFLFHNAPAYLIDFFFFILLKPRIAVKSYRKINKLLDLTSYFRTNSWEYDQGNLEDLWEEMGEPDREMFRFSMDDFDWTSYFEQCLLWGRVYLLKDPLETLPKALKKMKILKVAHYTLLTVTYYLLYRLLAVVICYLVCLIFFTHSYE